MTHAPPPNGNTSDVTEVPPRQSRAAHEDLARLQRQAAEAIPSLRARRRAAARRARARRSVNLLLVMALLVGVALIAVDAWGSRSYIADVVEEQVVGPAQGR